MRVRLTQLSQEHDQYLNDMGNSAARFHDAQEDLKGMLRTLARQLENLQGGTHPGSPQTETPVSVVMDVENLKSKATRLIEQVDQHNRHLNTLAPLQEKVQFLETLMEEWQRRFPVRSFGEEMEDIQNSIDLQEAFERLKRNNHRRMWEFRIAIDDLEAKVNILRSGSLMPGPLDTWKVVTDRLASVDQCQWWFSLRMMWGFWGAGFQTS